MAGYIGSKIAVTQVDGYNRTEADAEFVNDPNAVITVSSSNVGIGTSSPASKLHVQNDGGGSGGYLKATDVTYGGDVRFGMADGVNNSAIAGTWTNNSFLFYTNGNERMRIKDSGEVGIGTSSPTGELTIYKSSGSVALDITRGSNRWTIGEYDNSNLITIGSLYGVHPGIQLNTSGYLRCQGVYNDSAADSANVVVDGSGNIYRSTSALKYKQDIRDIEEIDISQFRPVRYKSNLERDDQTKDHFGFIADEAHDAGYTELVSYGVPDEETGVAEVEGFRYDRMTVLLTKVIQQQQATIDALEARVAALEAV